MFVAQTQQLLYSRKDFLLFRSSSFFRECISCVFLPAARKIVPIVGVGESRHAEFIAVIKRGNSAQSENQSKCEFLFFFGGPFGAAKARNVMICEEGNEQLRMRIKRILPKHICNAADRCAVQNYVANSEEQGEIEDRSESGIHSVPAFSAALKKGSNRRVRMKNFADCRELRVEPMQLCVPIRPELARNVRKSVFTEAIEACGFDPPCDVLPQVLSDDRVFCVEVRKNAKEPAVGEIAPQALRSVRVGKGFKRIVGYRRFFWKAVEGFLYWRKRIGMFLGRSVEPI